MSFATWDIETTTRTSYKRKGNPFDPDNWVVTHGLRRKDWAEHKVEEYRFGHSRPPSGWLKPVLDGTKLLAGFNIKFDVLHALQDAENLEAWMDWVANGGRIWDCQLAEYLLNGMGQRDQILSLDEVAPRYGGNVKFDEVKALWAVGINTPDIEPALLTRYLCGGMNPATGEWEAGDVENTERIALAQVNRAREAGQLQSILLNMDSLLCTIEMERNGMFVDKALGLSLAEELAKKLAEYRTALDSYLPNNLPFEFNWGSPRQKSALIFGGTVQWDAHEYDVDPTCPVVYVSHEPGRIYRHVYESLPADQRPRLLYSQMDVPHVTLATDTDKGKAGDLVPLQYAKDHGLPVVRNKGGKNAGEVKTKNVKVDNPDKPKGRGVKCPFVFPRMTEPKKQWETATPGVYSTGNDIIEELGNRDIPFLKVLSQFSAATKDLGTYFIVTDEETGESKGMLTLVDAFGIIHHSINHTSTVTGRFSSSNPNLQNIPKGNKSKVKLVFVSRFKDGVIIQSDFTALEIYVQAILTRCKQLIEDLKAGLDMHVLRLSNSPAGEGKTYEELLVLCKGDKKLGTEPVKEWDYKRTDSKVYSFQAAYGAGDAKIADTTGMAVSMVADLRAADDARYPEINAYFEKRTQEIKANRKPAGVVIPHPFVPGITCNLGRSAVRTPDGKLYSYMESPSPEYLVKRGVFQSFSPTEIKNYEVQGEGGEWAKAAMALAIRAFYKQRNFGGLALLVNQVHDALYADAHPDVKLKAAALLHACMEAASDYMEYLFKWQVPVPVPSDTTWGQSMMEEKSVPGLKEIADEYRQMLRRDYMGGYVPSFATKN